MKVLSLFNGMNCASLALHTLGVECEIYASEIDKYANQVSNALFPDTINLGDITKIDLDSLPIFDLVVGGSPCQGFSFAGKQLNFDDPRSKLFFDFVRILEYCRKKNPKVKFLLENVRMKKEYEAIISRFVGIDPILINSSLLSAQNRQRLYWTNIGTNTNNLFGIEQPGIPQPKDQGVLLKDILELGVDEKYYLSKKGLNSVTNKTRIKKKFTAINGDKAITLLSKGITNWTGTHINENEYLKIDKKGNIKNNQNKASCFTAGGNSGGNHSDMDLIAILQKSHEFNKIGYYKQSNNSIVQLNPSKESGNQPYQTNRVYDCNFRSPCLNTDARSPAVLIIPEATKKGYTYIRRLTPRECGRLQTVPEWAIDVMLNCGVSDSQLYKMYGNGWTIDVIAYILSFEYGNNKSAN
jgi:DNA (cytosine-5)-methyltransferase 3A